LRGKSSHLLPFFEPDNPYNGLPMPQPTFSRLFSDTYNYLETVVLPQFAWSDFHDTVYAYRQKRDGQSAMRVDTWPVVCCQAIGGQPADVWPVAAAWVLYILAGRIFDDVLDAEGDNQVWPDGRCQALPTGLFAIGVANQALTHLSDLSAHAGIARAFNQALATAARAEKGQIPLAQLNVETYFQRTAAKTGLVFGTGAWAGVRAACSKPDPALLDAVYTFGTHMGMMIQIVDDCEDIAIDLANQTYTLPLIYALSQSDHPAYPSLCRLLQPSLEPENVTAVVNVLIEMDAINWCLQAAAAYQQRAFSLLAEMGLPQSVLLQSYAHF
jgi:hypothetical protein